MAFIFAFTHHPNIFNMLKSVNCCHQRLSTHVHVHVVVNVVL